ncbi:flagellar biogenesis protein FlhB [Geotalea daltonii FRC-32]|uniref:Flagellar biosynthetic protein FlhB n=1 Tax=Geotalea daltonii (strain DSM 22248 / JCM 15807 / FRC-32) TaxID=316067 RepID=B9LZR6_GEODF|nr:flagellar biosynthesis protein FlhB [Geotalea daltonii]ACM18880.1 flagellar biogenesis protein FlhB [Geotalea daltonii FRC-32]
MSEEDKHSKTEQPTNKKVSEAKEKGNIPRSRDLTSTLSLTSGIIALYVTGGFMASKLKSSSAEIFASLSTKEFTEAGIYMLMLKLFLTMTLVLAPFLLIVIVASLAAEVSQGGISTSFEKIGFDLDKLNPVHGIKRLFNKDAVVEMLKSFLKIIIVGYMAYKVMRDEVDSVIYLVDMDIPAIAEFVSHISFKLVIHTCGVLFILAVLDLAFVKWRFIENLKMTKQEVKDENKDAEGDPHIKGKIKQKQYDQARRRMRLIIPTADVVVTNPTHFAVALKYDRQKMAAPVVLAKGADFLAQKIKEIARESNITLVENRPLARELFAQVKEGEEIPEALYAAVAEILAYVYKLKGKV